MNSEAVKMYKSIGFKRVVLGREISLAQIKRIKDAVPDMELETFVHGAMCIAYAGRCLMSAFLTGRSAQSGFCSHTCRWNFRVGEQPSENHIITPEEAKQIAQSGNLVIEEEQRKGEYFPIFEGDDFTAILSSKDINMINHLADMKAAGLDSLKIEGRMKSTYYVAMVTRAYRKALDALEGKISAEEAAPFIAELENVSHRESTTGFYYKKTDADKTTSGASDSKYQLAAQIGKEIKGEDFKALLNEGQRRFKENEALLASMHPDAREARIKDYEIHPDRRIIPFEQKDGWHLYECTAMNKINATETIEFVSPSFCNLPAKGENEGGNSDWELISSETGLKLNWVCDSHPCVIYTRFELPDATLLRTLDPDYEEGKIRDNGR